MAERESSKSVSLILSLALWFTLADTWQKVNSVVLLGVGGKEDNAALCCFSRLVKGKREKVMIALHLTILSSLQEGAQVSLGIFF